MTRNASPDYVFVDGSAVLFRCYHAMPPLVTSTGQPTGAVKGFINTTKQLHKRFANSQIIMIFDSPGPSFRKEIYDLYKANRTAMPEELATQIAPIFAFIEHSGYPLIRLAGYEADDIIATYCQQAEKDNKSVLIASNDKDLAQLVSDKVYLYDSTKDKATDRNGVFERFGVWPEQVRDFLALTGDSSDNIPGVPGVGPKKAAAWLAQFGTLASLLEHQQEITGKTGEKLRHATQETIPLAIRLVNLDFDCPLDQRLEQLKEQPADQSALVQLGHSLEMIIQSQVEKESKQLPCENNDTTHDYEVITSKAQLHDWIEAILQKKYVAFDTETDGLDAMSCQLVGLSMALTDGRSCYLPLAHDDDDNQLDRHWVLTQLAAVFGNDQLYMVGQNLKFDMHVLARYGVNIACQLGDTMLQSYCLDATRRQDLDSLARRFLSWQAISFEDIVGKGKNQKTFNQIPVDQAAAYAAEDAWLAMRLDQLLTPQLRNQEAVWQVYQQIEMPLMPAIQAMEQNGVLIDSDKLNAQSRQLEEKLIELATICYELSGLKFNINSPKQLQVVLFEHLQLPSSKKTAGGQASTSEEILSELAHDYELPQRILDYRSLKKLQSTYTDKLPQLVHPNTGRLHSSFHQAVTSTGRLSSSRPNLQNIPIRTSEGRHIRAAFVAEEGNMLIAADYSQIELRIMAHLSQDQGLLTAFAQGEDVHRATAAEIFNVATDQVSDDQRRNAKAINFGLIYGMSAFGLSRQLAISRQQAVTYMETYFNRYPGVLRYMEGVKESARAKGYVETLAGRRLYINQIDSSNKTQQMAAERVAINAPMQGTAADIIKKAMIQLYNHWQSDPHIRMILQVHDELVFEVPQDRAESCRQQIVDMMSHTMQLSVPLVVEAGIAKNWLDAH